MCGIEDVTVIFFLKKHCSTSYLRKGGRIRVCLGRNYVYPRCLFTAARSGSPEFGSEAVEGIHPRFLDVGENEETRAGTVMWYLMENAQRSYTLSERLLRAIGMNHEGTHRESEDIEDLIRQGADVNQSHGTFLPLHCACIVGDASSVSVLLKWGANVSVCMSISHRY